MATRIPSLTRSATRCDRNCTIFRHPFGKEEPDRSTKIECIRPFQVNLTLALMQKKQEENGDAYDPIGLPDMESYGKWITKREFIDGHE